MYKINVCNYNMVIIRGSRVHCKSKIVIINRVSYMRVNNIYSLFYTQIVHNVHDYMY